MQNRRRDGSEFFISLNTSAVRDDRGEIIGLLGVARDISDRLHAELALRDAEERMRFALEASNVGVWEASLKTGVAFFSATCETMRGLAPGTFGRTYAAFLERIHPDDRAVALQQIDQAIRDHGRPSSSTARSLDHRERRSTVAPSRSTRRRGARRRRRRRRDRRAARQITQAVAEDGAIGSSPAASPTTSTTC